MNRQQRRRTKKEAGASQSDLSGQLNNPILQATQHLEAGRFKEAEDSYRAIIVAMPEVSEVHQNLGYVLEKQNKLDEAAACYERALTLKPDLAEAHYSFGNILHRQGKLNEAERCFRRALNIKPDYVKAYIGLGDILTQQENYDEAARCYDRALTINPNYAEAHYGLGYALLRQGKLDEAEQCYERALTLNPQLEKAHHNLGTIFQDVGKPEDALKSYDRALSIKPDFAEAHFNRAAVKSFRPEDPDLAALKRLAKTDNLTRSASIYTHFGLGKALEDVKDYAHAFEHLLKGNTLRRQEIQYSEATELEKFQQIASAFTPGMYDRIESGRNTTPTPIFILGMPRSGTSLVEQILASHPLVHGAGELDILNILLNGVRDGAGKLVPYPAFVPMLDVQNLQKLGQAYLQSLPAIPEGKTFITDKMPFNFRFVGLIPLMLPNAKIIHTMRDPVDTCVSCFSTLFTSSQYFSYDLGELGRYYRGYRKLMDHWRSVLPPGAMFDLSYEGLVENFEPQVRRLLSYCGLPWDDHCLSFYKTKRTVKTASSFQVRQPLYNKSVQRWRRYEPYLGPLLSELGVPPSP